jgi:hypothetical protein
LFFTVRTRLSFYSEGNSVPSDSRDVVTRELLQFALHATPMPLRMPRLYDHADGMKDQPSHP